MKGEKDTRIEELEAELAERKRAGEFAAGQNRVLEMIATRAPLGETLAELTRLVESQFEGMLGSALLLDEDGTHVRHGAAPSLPESYTRAVDGEPIGPKAGSCGTAMFRREPVVVTDILEDPLWDDYRHLAAAHGLRACWSTPIFSSEYEVLGSFAMYYREARSPTPGEARLIDVAAHMAGIAIERERAEEALRASEERFAAAFHSSPIPLCIGTLDEGRCLSVNDQLLRVTGYAREEVIGRTSVELGLWGGPEARARVVEALEREGGLRDVEITFPTKRGEPRTVLCSIELIDLKGRKCTMLAAIDITERKRLEEQLMQSQKMEAVGRLAGGVAHDFNNLLTAILGYSDLALARIPEADPLREPIEAVRNAGARASALTSQLLAFSRRQVLQPKILDPNAVVAEMDAMLRRLIGEDVDLVTVLDPGCGSVEADPGQLGQVIMNLAVNARDAMARGGTLRIETSRAELDETFSRNQFAVRPGPYVRIAVTDTGAGMDEQTRSRVFEPFFTTKGTGKGTGLGLSTVYGIVKQSDGYIWVTSEPGHGACFEIYLPRVERRPDAPEARAGRGEPAGGRETILLVEDEETVRRLASRILTSAGYTVLEAAGGDEALLESERHSGPIHLVITDVVMPQMSGRDLADRLAARRPEARVLYMSGYTDDAIVHHGILEPGIAFLQKPFTADGLLGEVRRQLGDAD